MKYFSLSVVIPCHNYGQYLSYAILSIQKQKAANNVEIIVVDDFSDNEETLSILNYWNQKQKNIRVITNPNNKGISFARNIGIEYANSDWIGFLDADDVWTDNSVQIRLQAIANNPTAEWFGGDFVKLYKKGITDSLGQFKKSAYHHLSKAFQTCDVMRLKKPIKEFLDISMGWTGVEMIRKDLLERVNGFNVTLERYEDHHLWYRLSAITDFYFVPEILALYRQHGNSVSDHFGHSQVWFIKSLKLLLDEKEFRPYKNLINKKIGDQYLRDSYYFRSIRQRKKAVLSAFSCIKYQPIRLISWRNLMGTLMGRE